MSSDIRLTEERLRNHLDTNQVMRERMCLALLPILGPYTREQPRRPKGGPDGGRDLEAIFQGRIPVWGAIGFKNGGGADDSARRWAADKFKSDLDSAHGENPTLLGFVFFTNVDLTPGIKQELIKYAQAKRVAFIDIFDMERLRHILDTPEGLLVRLQYLDISMSASEQAALVGKYGSQLQNAVTARFDRVERTLSQMERFLDLQKPLYRLDFYFQLTEPSTSAAIGDEAILLVVNGLHDITGKLYCLCINNYDHSRAAQIRVMSARIWNHDRPGVVLTLPSSVSLSPHLLTSFSQLSLSMGGHRVRLGDLSAVSIEALCTERFRSTIRGIAVDANGYALFEYAADGQGEATSISWAPNLEPFNPSNRNWVNLLMKKDRDMLFMPPVPSPRGFLPLQNLPL
jgi:hypothetical protein